MGKLFGLLILTVLVLAACQSSTQEPTFPPTQAPPTPTQEPPEIQAVTPSVTVQDQSIEKSSVAIAEVVNEGPGWLVIHAQADGKPGPILGYSPVNDGVNKDVIVMIEAANATETLYAMLHTDAGEVGQWEFPDGPDVPVKIGDALVNVPFAATRELTELTPSVTVEDQSIDDGAVTVVEVVSDGPGWLVIHAQADGRPGPILGYSPVGDGVNKGAVIEIDSTNATNTLYAMLHVDDGKVGEWEFPDGPDVPVKVDENVVTTSFKIAASEITTADMTGEPLVVLGGNQALGAFLTDLNGRTLYTFAKDETGLSNCYDECAQNWPPLLLEDGQALSTGEGVSGELGTISRSDGGTQVAYNGAPLYYWIDDESPGDANGHGANNVWAVAREQTPVILMSNNSKYGRILTGANGMTLYIFAKDGPGKSNCSDQCAANWPPLLLADGQVLTGGPGVIGKLGTIVRPDESIQITYNGMPLYYWINDLVPGDATGHGVNDVWIIANQWASPDSFEDSGGGGGYGGY